MSTTLTIAPDGTVVVTIGADAPVAPLPTLAPVAPPVELSTTVAPPVATPVAPAKRSTRRTTPATPVAPAPVAHVGAPVAPAADAPAKRVKRTKEQNVALLADIRGACRAGDYVAARAMTPAGWASTFAEIDRHETKRAAAPVKAKRGKRAPTTPVEAPTPVAPVKPASAVKAPPTPSEDKPKRAPVARDARGRILSKAAATKLIAPDYAPTPEQEHVAGAAIAARDAEKDARHLLLAEFRKAIAKRVRELVKAGDVDDLTDAYVDWCEMRDALDDAAADATGAHADVLTQKALMVANAADKVEKAAEKLQAANA